MKYIIHASRVIIVLNDLNGLIVSRAAFIAPPVFTTSLQTQTVSYKKEMSFLLCVPLMIGIKISTVGLLFFKIHQTPHRDEVHFLRRGKGGFSDYTLVSPIIPDQSQKNVGEKSVDNSGET